MNRQKFDFTLVNRTEQADLLRVNATGKFLWQQTFEIDSLYSVDYHDEQTALQAMTNGTIEWQTTPVERPRFKHNCDNCDFQGSFFDHDVWICKGEFNQLGGYPSIIARYGDDGPDYASMPIDVMRTPLTNPDAGIGGIMLPNGSMNYREWLVSEYACKSTQAMVFALAIVGIDSLKTTP